MRVCAIQPPYPYSLESADRTIDFLIHSLRECSPENDLILLPEYSNAPTVYPEGECIRYAAAHTDPLIATCVETAKRCKAIIAVNLAAEVDGSFRNTTRVFNWNGEWIGDYCKQHLPYGEVHTKKMDDSYTFDYTPPRILETEGIRLGFLTCYDCYFNEYIAHLAARKPDIVLISSHQRSERPDILKMQVCQTAFQCNAFVVRASVSMGMDRENGGCSMIAGPDARVLAAFRQETGTLSCEIGDPHRKYMRSNCFGGTMILNDSIIEQGRTPWSYRACGSMVKPGDAQQDYPRVCAHRGFNAIAPENSMPAFGAAVALGIQEIELDIWKTRDGEIVVCHDESIDSVSAGEGKIQDMDFAELQRYDFGCRRGENFAGLKIPRLEDVLKTFARQVIVNLHIKSPGTGVYERSTMSKIVDLVRKYDMAEHLYITGRRDVMETALEVAPEIRRCMGAGLAPMEVVEHALLYRCSKVQFMKPHVNAAMIERAHAHHLRCNLFWEDDPEKAKEWIRMGIDTILSNRCLIVANAVDLLYRTNQ